VCSSAG